MSTSLPYRYRLAVASRALAAIGGGYLLAAAATTVLSLILPLSRSEAVVTATLLSFLVYAGAVIGVFAARNAWRAWAGIAIPTVILALAGAVLGRG
jgi:hypothetical protein